MIAFPSKVLIIADYEKYHFEETLRSKFDFVLSCGDVPFHVLEEIHDLYKKPIFAVKGNHDPVKSFPKCVEDVHHRMVHYVYHGHVHSSIGTMIVKTAVVSVFGSKIVTLD